MFVICAEYDRKTSLKNLLMQCCLFADTNLVSVVASYVYHRHNTALPRLAVALLRRISLVAPMSLYACLGPDVAATR